MERRGGLGGVGVQEFRMGDKSLGDGRGGGGRGAEGLVLVRSVPLVEAVIRFSLRLYTRTADGHCLGKAKTNSFIDISTVQSNTTQLVILLKCISYIVWFNDMFRL